MSIIKIKSRIDAPVSKVWKAYTSPKHIVNWNFASPDWHCPSAENDLRIGGKYKARMDARDGSFGFDFEAVYDQIIPNKLMTYTLTDGRKVICQFEEEDGQTEVTTEFETENQNPQEMQRDGWQAILNNFKSYVENLP